MSMVKFCTTREAGHAEENGKATGPYYGQVRMKADCAKCKCR